MHINVHAVDSVYSVNDAVYSETLSPTLTGIRTHSLLRAGVEL